MENLKLEFHPSQAILNSFFPELKKEYEQKGYGIYCNWDIIQNFFKKDKIIILTLNNNPISFVTWRRSDKVISLDIIWSLPQYRGKGLGYKFQQLLFKEFKKRGDVAIVVNCATSDGVSMAKRNGFIPQNLYSCFNNHNISFNPNISFSPNPSYIKILKNSEPLHFKNEDFRILCFEEFHNNSSYFGEIPLNVDFEAHPAFYYINFNWECKIVYNGEIVHESKMKYILYELKIKTYDYIVAYFNHKIDIPKHWLK